MSWSTRRIAWAVVALGSVLLAVFGISRDIADRRNSEFFEEGYGWYYGHLVGGALVLYTLAAVIVLIVTPVRVDEARMQRWTRAAWSVVLFLAYVLVVRLLRLLLVGLLA